MSAGEWVGLAVAVGTSIVAVVFVVLAVIVVKRMRAMQRSAEELVASVARAQQSLQARLGGADGDAGSAPSDSVG